MNQVTVLIVVICVISHTAAMQGGQPAASNEFPYMVSVRDSLNIHICGGTIIAPIWVLTSSICFTRSWYGHIRYGSNNLDDQGELPVDRSKNVIGIVGVFYNPHASDLPPYPYDAALIHTNEPIPFSDTVAPIQVASLEQEWPSDKTATILGWGAPQGWESQTQLQKAKVPLLKDEVCADYDFNGWQIINTEIMKCGGVENTTYHCYDDYGGPVVVDGVQYGILSYVKGVKNNYTECGLFVNIYSPVSHSRKWIKEMAGV